MIDDQRLNRSIVFVLALVLSLLVSPISASKTTDDAAQYIALGNYGAAEDILLPLARSKDRAAQYSLGWLYKNASGEYQDDSKSRYWFTEASKGGDQDAQYELIKILIDDEATKNVVYTPGERNCFVRYTQESGEYVWKLCREVGVPGTYQQLDKWLEAITTSPSQDLIKFLKQEVQRDSPAAHLILGALYNQGKVLARSEKLALEHLEAAAKYGIPAAQTLLAALVMSIDKVQRDYQAAHDLLVQAAGKGYREAQYRLGRLYINVESPLQNREQALIWFLEAERQGEARARIHLGLVNYDKQDYLAALGWFRKADKDGDHWAGYKIAEMYYFGRGVPANLKTTQRRLRRPAKSNDELDAIEAAAELGDLFAQVAIAYLYEWTGKDFRKAFDFYFMAARQADVFAQRRIGHFYEKGIGGVTKDFKTARQWYEKAISQGDKTAKIMLLKLDLAEERQRQLELAEAEKRRKAEELAEAERKRKAKEAEEKRERELAEAERKRRAKEAEEKRQRELAEAEKKRKEKEAENKRQRELAEADRKRKEAEDIQRRRDCGEPSEALGDIRIIGAGTGFAVNDQGYVVTNEHVVTYEVGEYVHNCDAIATYYKGIEEWARIVQSDPVNDLAIIRTCRSFPSFGYFRNRNFQLEEGELVAAYGYPLPSKTRLKPRITDGIVSALSGLGNDTTTLQHTASIQSGNSGGPLLDLMGNIVGVNVAVYERNQEGVPKDKRGPAAQLMNFAIKADLTRSFLKSNDVSSEEAVAIGGKELAYKEVRRIADKFTMAIFCYGKKTK